MIMSIRSLIRYPLFCFVMPFPVLLPVKLVNHNHAAPDLKPSPPPTRHMYEVKYHQLTSFDLNSPRRLRRMGFRSINRPCLRPRSRLVRQNKYHLHLADGSNSRRYRTHTRRLPRLPPQSPFSTDGLRRPELSSEPQHTSHPIPIPGATTATRRLQSSRCRWFPRSSHASASSFRTSPSTPPRIRPSTTSSPSATPTSTGIARSPGFPRRVAHTAVVAEWAAKC